MQTVYEDGPKRDQRPWIGDLYPEALANDCSNRQHALTRRCLYLLAGCADSTGVLAGTLFERPEPHAQHKQFPLDYSLLYNVTLKNRLTATADRKTAESLWPVVVRQLENVRPYLRKNGLPDYERASRKAPPFRIRPDDEPPPCMRGVHPLKGSEAGTVFFRSANTLRKARNVRPRPEYPAAEDAKTAVKIGNSRHFPYICAIGGG